MTRARLRVRAIAVGLAVGLAAADAAGCVGRRWAGGTAWGGGERQQAEKSAAPSVPGGAHSVSGSELQPGAETRPAQSAESVAPPAPMPARYLRTLEYRPTGYGAGEVAADSDLLLGDLLFHSPRTLGPRAQALGLSCHSCHPNGAAHGTLKIPGLSDQPGNVDLSTAVLAAGADDGVANALNVPSLRGCRYTGPYGRDGRIASLAEFVQQVVTSELGGAPLPERERSALVRYLLDLDFLPNANLDPRNQLRARTSEAARRGERLFAQPRGPAGVSCASCHPASSFFRDGRVHRLGSGSPPSPYAIDGGYETPSLLGLAESAPYFHDGRFTTLAEVVAWFDRELGLQLGAQEQADLVAYLEAVGAVDRSADDRPLARQLDERFAYAGLLAAERSRRVWIAALESLHATLHGAPLHVAQRAAQLQAELAALHAQVEAGAALPALATRARPLRATLARLAADWAGGLNASVADPTQAAR